MKEIMYCSIQTSNRSYYCRSCRKLNPNRLTHSLLPWCAGTVRPTKGTRGMNYSKTELPAIYTTSGAQDFHRPHRAACRAKYYYLNKTTTRSFFQTVNRAPILLKQL